MDLNRPKIDPLESFRYQMARFESFQKKINQMERQMDEVHISHTRQLRNLEEISQNMKNEIENLKEDSQKKDNIIEKLNNELTSVKEDSNKKMECLMNEILNLKKMKVKNEGSKDAFQEKSSHGLESGSKRFLSKERTDIHDYRGDVSAGNCGDLSKTKPNHNSVAYEWKIYDFVKRREEAISKFNKKIYSEPFYSRINGYKLRLRVNPNGFGDVENTYLSVFFSIVNGEYDDALSWPMKRQVTIALIDQISGEIFISEKYKLTSIDEEFEVIFDKPSKRIKKDDDYYYYGTPNFIELDQLINNRSLIKNGSILLKCFID